MTEPERKDCTVKVDCLEVKASVIPPVIKTESKFEYYSNHWGLLVLQIFLTIVFSCLGFYLTGVFGVVVSLVIGLLSIFLLPSWQTKTVRIEKESTQAQQ